MTDDPELLVRGLIAEIEQLRGDRNQMADAYREAAADNERLRHIIDSQNKELAFLRLTLEPKP